MADAGCSYYYESAEERVQEIGDESTYANIAERQQSSPEPQPSALSTSKDKPKRLVFVSIVAASLFVLFGLAITGIILVTQEKLQLDQANEMHHSAAAELHEQVRKLNGSVPEKLETEVEETSHFLQKMIQNHIKQSNQAASRQTQTVHDIQRQINDMKQNITRMELLKETSHFLQETIQNHIKQSNQAASTQNQTVHDMQRQINEMKQNITRMERLKGCPQTKINFPREGQTNDWIRIKAPIPTTDAISICAWLTPLTPSGLKGTITSYALPLSYNEFLVYFADRKSATICFDQCIKIPILITSRTHFCVAASPSNAWAKIYRNGVLQHRLDYSAKRSVTGGGVILLGQDQDDVAGLLDPKQAFGGTIENFMMWYRALDDNEIQGLYKDRCNCPLKPAITLATSEIQIEGKVTSSTADQC